MPSNTTDATALLYRIRVADAAAHLYEVTLDVARPDPEGQRFALPAWIPGSYMIREFARHVVQIEARAGRRRVPIEKVDKHQWHAGRCNGPLQLRYTVYAWDLSVRGAHLDDSHGFFNGTSVFLRVLGQEAAPCVVEIEAPRDPALADWRVATTLPRAPGADGARQWGFGRYLAADYDALIDHPVEMGRFAVVSFDAAGARHEVVITGRHDCDGQRLARDLAPVCAAQAALFEPKTKRAPFDRYLFLTTVVGDGYGGLEHRDSTALLCNRNDLPHPGMKEVSDGYRTFLGLASHEYFHSWHVKRIKPAAFSRYDLDRENYTRLLWVFEGFTSYYDDLMLVRSGALDGAGYLKALAGTVSAVLRGPGRQVQSVAESSFDAWIKYYRQDENSPNSVVSYYAKGALVALALDLSVRLRTRGRRSLDDLMRLMWRRFGRDFASHGEGVPEDALPGLLHEATGVDLSDEIARWALGFEDPPLEALLAKFGVTLALSAPDSGAPWLGVRTTTRGNDLAIATAYRDGPAHAAGLSAGDVIVAVDGLRVDDKGLKTLLSRRSPSATLKVHAFRRDELREFSVKLGKPPATEAKLSMGERVPATVQALRRGWIGPARAAR